MTPIRRYRRGLKGSPLEDWILERLATSASPGTVDQSLPPAPYDEAPPPPSPPPACPGCGGPCGDGDRVLYGRCGRCAGCYPTLPPAPTAARRCWCGRRVSTLPSGNGIECSEHDSPIPDTGPSTPLTPGGVLDRRYP